MTELEKHFAPFAKKIIGLNKTFDTPYGKKQIIYTDWIASGRLYSDIEKKITNDFGPYVANTHTETSETGTIITKSYHYAKKIIKKHVNANNDDILINAGRGMTGAVNKLIRILGFKYDGKYFEKKHLLPEDIPLVIVSHMEHHSNHTSWLTTIADVIIVKPDKENNFSFDNLKKILTENKNRKYKIVSVSAASNITGIKTDYKKIASIAHKNNAFCFVDFAASAPYVDIDMHPKNDKLSYLDAIFFSPHKFLGGPGSAGVLIFNKKLYNNKIPDHTGGGIVKWTNAWNEYAFVDEIEEREDAGTPAFLQTIRTALVIKLKQKMNCKKIEERENEINKIIFDKLLKIKNIVVLAKNNRNRLSVFSFYHKKIHYNLFVKLLSDVFGIQVRGGCACAGTYGHFLLNIKKTESHKITNEINSGNLSHKPGFVRLSLHPTTTNNQIDYIINAIKTIDKDFEKYQQDYIYNKTTNEFYHKNFKSNDIYKKWFAFSCLRHWDTQIKN